MELSQFPFRVQVEDFVRVGATNTSFFVLHVQSHSTEWRVLRRFSELRALHMAIRSTALSPEYMPPSARTGVASAYGVSECEKTGSDDDDDDAIDAEIAAFPPRKLRLFSRALDRERCALLRAYSHQLALRVRALGNDSELNRRSVQRVLDVIGAVEHTRHMAASGDVETLKYVHFVTGSLSYTDRADGSLLHHACARGRVDTLRYLVGVLGEDALHREDKFGLTPMQVLRLSCADVGDMAEFACETDDEVWTQKSLVKRRWEWRHLPLQYRKSHVRDWNMTVLVNPFSGTGKALSLQEHCVAPLLRAMGVRFNTHVTRCAGEAESLAARARFSVDSADDPRGDGFDDDGSDVFRDTDLVVVISGDGLCFELLNGLARRCDARDVLQTVSFAMVPGGSGNGYANSCGWPDAQTATLRILDGVIGPTDMMSVEQPQAQVQCNAFLAVTWGLMADIDFLSESYRWMGASRFTVEGVRRVVAKKSYSARLHFLPADRADGHADESPRDLSALTPEKDWVPPASWVTVDDGQDLSFVYICNTEKVSADFSPCPEARPHSGHLSLCYATGLSRAGIAKVLIQAEKGEHVNLEQVHNVAVREVVIEPRSTGRTCFGVDGERLQDLPTRISVRPHALRFAC